MKEIAERRDKNAKKKIKSILCILCLLLNLVFPILRVNVCATEPPSKLDFQGENELVDGKIVYTEGPKKCTIELVEKGSTAEDYTHVDITGKSMGIDLESKNYYLKVTNSNSDQVSGADTSPLYNTLCIGATRLDISINPSYVKLDPDQFSGILEIKLEKGSAPSPTIYPDDISINATYDGFGMTVRLNGERVGNESDKITGTGKGYASGDMNNSIGIQTAFGGGYIGSVTVNGKSCLPLDESLPRYLLPSFS